MSYSIYYNVVINIFRLLTVGFGVKRPTAIKIFVGTKADSLKGIKIFSFVSG